MAKSIKGTQTEKNLLTSFAGESQARMRYTYFASAAKKEGYEQIAAIFTETADQEKEHAKRMFKFLEGGMVEITASYPAGVIGECHGRPWPALRQSLRLSGRKAALPDGRWGVFRSNPGWPGVLRVSLILSSPHQLGLDGAKLFGLIKSRETQLCFCHKNIDSIPRFQFTGYPAVRGSEYFVAVGGLGHDGHTAGIREYHGDLSGTVRANGVEHKYRCGCIQNRSARRQRICRGSGGRW